MIVIFSETSTVFADDVNLTADTYTYQGQSQGNTQGITFNSKTPDVNTHRSYIQSNAGTELLFPPQAHYFPNNPWRIWMEASCFLPEQLYSYERAAKLIENDGDIVQFTGKPLTIGLNNAPVRFLRKIPMGKNDIKLWEVWIEGPTNSFLNESILRIVSIGKAITGAKRVLIKYREFAHSMNAGNAFGNATGTSLISGTTAWANSASPQFGKSEARAYPVHNVVVYFYNGGHVQNAVAAKTPAKKDLPDMVFFSGSKFELKESAIAKNTEWLKKRWRIIRKNGVKVIFNSFYLNSQNSALSEDAAYDVMLEVGANLREQGISEEELADTLLYVAKPANPGQQNILKSRGETGVVMITTQKI